MSFAIYTDSAANLPREKLRALELQVIPGSYELDGKIYVCPDAPEEFDGHHYYERLRKKALVRTSLTNSEAFALHFRRALEAGQDVLYVSISSGISGTCQSARLAAELLAAEYPERRLYVFDSLGAGMGIGLLVLRAAGCRDRGMSLPETVEQLEQDRKGLCEYFTVDDLMFLKRGGRASGLTALIGSMLNIKPILRGDESGHIVACGKVRGRKKAIEAIAAEYAEKAVRPSEQCVAISHGDCLEDARELARRIQEIAAPKELILTMHEPFTGAHVGPGMLSLFFLGSSR